MDKQIEELTRQLEALQKIRSVCETAWGGAKQAVADGGLSIEDLVRYAWTDLGGPARKVIREEEAIKEAKRAGRAARTAEPPAKAPAGRAKAAGKAKTKAKGKAKGGKKVVIPGGRYRLPNEDKVYTVNVRGPRAMALVNAATEMGLEEFIRVCRVGD
jgi:hypothetical protein